jgi:hypothetical protein
MANRLLSLFRNLFRKDAVEKELDEEIRVTVEILAEEKMREDLSPGEARRQAPIELGGMEPVKEAIRYVRPGRWIEDLGRDVHYGVRSLSMSPGFTAAALLVLALGIGLNTAMFSAIDAVLFRAVPVKDSDDLVTLYTVYRKGDNASLAGLILWNSCF